jgi:hypothetical protein
MTMISWIVPAILALATPVEGTTLGDPFSAGNCAVIRAEVVLDTAGHGEGQRLERGSFLKLLARKDDRVEVAWIPNLNACSYTSGVFAGWVRRSDMAREYPARAYGNKEAAVQPIDPAPIFDAPNGQSVGRTHRNDNLLVIERKSDGWLLVTSSHGHHSPKNVDWRQPRGWVSLDSLEPFVLADPTGPVPRGESAAFHLRPETAPDGGDMVEILGKQFSSRQLCNCDSFVPQTFLSRLADVPYAFVCGPVEDDPGPILVTAFSSDGRPHTTRLKQRNVEDRTITTAVKTLIDKVSGGPPPNKPLQR